jgi:hypothetical protein
VKRICRKCEHEKRVEYRQAHPPVKRQDPDRFLKQRRGNLKKNFGITIEQYNVLFETQNGKCAICGLEHNGYARSGRKQNFAVDDCHQTGRVRGLLCGNCNLGIGNLRDNPDILRAAAAYLERHK